MQKIITITELNNKLFYKSNDVITVYGTAGGFFTSGGKDLSFSIPVDKSLDNISSAKITSAKLTIRQNDFYCFGSGTGHETVNLNTDNPRANLSKNNRSLNIGFTFPVKRASVNNDSCGIIYEMNIKFS